MSVSMSNSETIVRCSNSSCSKPNSLKNHFCKQCRTPLIKRYLWAIEIPSDLTDEAHPDEELVEEVVVPRYVPFGDRIFLDTHPKPKKSQIPKSANLELPSEIVDYLQLLNCFPHVPKVHARIEGSNLWLLDYGTVPLNSQGELVYPDLLPSIESVWGDTTSTKQLSWLIQIASLWQPLAKKFVRQTLLKPELIAVNGSLIQLRELCHDEDALIELSDLGRVWSHWAQSAQPQIKEVLLELTQQICTGGIATISEVMVVLEQALEICSQSQQYSAETYAISESGPRRKNNQDHAYPDFATPAKVQGAEHSLAIVCDGVGGHEGGEIASQHTVSYIRERLEDFEWNPPEITPAQIVNQLADLTNEANDALNDRNNREQRQERQRMGTTLVMALARKYELFLNHVGDSRIYLITPESCHQVTTDDDLASRETRLGYALYRDALQYPSAGALIQALGMRHSDSLHPNLRRLTIEGDYILLLCTDGLSDFDRVEQYWRDVLLPVFKGKWDLTTAVKAFIKIANERNGHDNATVALVHFQVQSSSDGDRILTWNDIEQYLHNSGKIWEDEHFTEESFFETDSLVEFSTSVQDLSDTQIAIAPTQGSTTTVAAGSASSAPRSPKTSRISMIVSGLVSLLVLSLGVVWYVYNQQDRELSPTNESSEVRDRVGQLEA